MTLKSLNNTQTKFEERQSNDRLLRDCIILIHAHLQSFGYIETAAKLISEVGGGRIVGHHQTTSLISRFECADNINLMRIIYDYEEFHEIKFGCKPKLSRVAVANNNSIGDNNNKKGNSKYTSTTSSKDKHVLAAKRRLSKKFACNSGNINEANNNNNSKGGGSGSALATINIDEKMNREKNNNIDNIIDINKSSSSGCGLFDDTVIGNAVRRENESSYHEFQDTQKSEDDNISNLTLTKPLPDFGGDMELRSLASTIQSEIIQSSSMVKWEDVVDLEDAKRLLKEAVVMPLKYPHIFTGLLSPWRGILLYGPPGTGKTMLAKAVATECNTTFFNISSSSIVSKYRGESEKLVRVLFTLARHYSPSTIFFDEIDSLLSHRGGGGGSSSSSSSSTGENMMGGGGEHEGSRRLKTELLVQMDGIMEQHGCHVFVLAASNLPWDLDPAFLRRLEKRVFVPLPNATARIKMFMYYLLSSSSKDQHQHQNQHQHRLSFSEDIYFKKFAEMTKGYSGADIKLVCKEAAMRPLRRIFDYLHNHHQEVGTSNRNKDGSCSQDDILKCMKNNPITVADLEESIASTNPTVAQGFCKRYDEWKNSFGSV